MKTILVMAATCLLLFVGLANASTMWWEFTIDGADLMSFQTANGAVGDTAVQAGLTNGARLYRSNEGFGDLTGDDIVDNNDWLRSHWGTSNDEFTSWAENTTDRLGSFNLWGYDGSAANWGEEYKVQYWNGASSTVPGWSSDPNWQGWIIDWPWGSFEDYANGQPGYGDQYNDGRILGWDAASYADSLGFGDSAYPTFTFRVGLNDADAFFGDGGWYNGVEGQLAFWFGGSMVNSSGEWQSMYEGNIVLQGTASQPVPEPSTLVLVVAGLAALAGVRRKMK